MKDKVFKITATYIDKFRAETKDYQFRKYSYLSPTKAKAKKVAERIKTELNDVFDCTDVVIETYREGKSDELIFVKSEIYYTDRKKV